MTPPITELIIIPAYNEADSIGPLIQRLQNEGHADILVVNDGSTDDTEAIVRNLGVSVISLPINLGIGGAVQTGFRYAVKNRYDAAIQFDGDGQHDSKYIEDLLRPILEDRADVVIGSRFIQKAGFQSSFLRRTGIKILQSLNSVLTGKKITDCTSGFRAYNFKAYSFLSESYSVDFPEPEAIIALLKKGFRILEVPVVMKGREAGTSSIYGFKSVYYVSKVFLSIVFEYFRRSQ
jgi:glycosyltransferase involved in cell wall biosynthesis